MQKKLMKYNQIIIQNLKIMNLGTKSAIPIIFLLCLLLFFSVASQKKANDMDNMKIYQRQSEPDRQKKKLGHQDNHIHSDIQLSFVIQATEQQRRFLAASDPHGFRATPIYPSPVTINIDISILKRIYSAASKYIETTFQVTELPASLSTYPSNNGTTCGTTTVPSDYITNGFSQNTSDAIIFLSTTYNIDTYMAQGGACVYATWPTYGFIIYNERYIAEDLSNNGKYHANILATVHQFFHIFGMNNWAIKNRMRGTYGASGFLASSQTIANHPSKVGVQMVIMNNTKSYVQSYFSCNETNIGALLEDVVIAGSTGSNHWEREVYLDEIMTTTDFFLTQKISALSLNFLKDTGYFYSVDLSKVVPVYFGKGKGCNFALNLATSATPEYCSGSTSGCSFYGEYQGYCSSQPLTSGKYIRPYANRICNKIQTNIQSGIIPGDYYSAKGRCITFSGMQHCYKIYCTSNNAILIDINGQIVTCAAGATSMTTSWGETVICPTNNANFCQIKQCENWCSTQGLCINGICIIAQNCTQSITNCLSCVLDNFYRCTLCDFDLFPNKDGVQCVTCASIITNAQTCVRENNVTKVAMCSQSYLFPSFDRLSCEYCNITMKGCFSCEVVSGHTFCRECIPGRVLASDRLSCVLTCTISDCSNCTDVTGNQTCTKCSNNKYPSQNQLSCDTCENIFPYCTACIWNPMFNRTECAACANKILADPPLSCPPCRNAIPDCQNCGRNAAGTKNCYSCLNSKVPAINLQGCVDCAARISDCEVCAVSGAGFVTCLDCTTSENVPNINKTACINCANRIANCDTCNVNLTGDVTCGYCVANYIPSSDQRTCKTCREHITQCTECLYNAITKVGTCTACTTGYFPSINGLSCKRCAQLISKCNICQSNNICAKCVVGYYANLNRSSCFACSSPCKSCQTSAVTCQSCIQGYYLIALNSSCVVTPKTVQSYGGVCNIAGLDIFCQKGCKVCQCSSPTSQTCLSARQGYSLHSGGYVVKCAQGCATCSAIDPATCFTCLNRYTLSLFSPSCSLCHSSCASCFSSDPTVCLTCPQGSQINSQGTCSVCTAQDCKICSQNGSCQTCNDGFYLDTTGKCQECIFNCGTCLQNDINTCTSCGDTFYLNGTSCLDCPVGCRSCNATSCSSCISGYFINVTSNTCHQVCDFLCATCSPTDSSVCLSCFGGYNLSSGKCIANYCTSGCTACPLGTRLNSGSCQNCTFYGCSECPIDSSTCQSCLPGYYLVSSSQCSKCPQQCVSCRSEIFCTECKSGYTFVKEVSQATEKTIEGKCLVCISPCKTCILNPNHCQNCIENYQLNDHKCVVKNKITIRIILDGALPIFYSNLGGPVNFKAILLKLLGYSQPKKITFNKIKSGSIQIDAQVGNEKDTSELICGHINNLKSNLTTGSSLQGLNILESQFTASDSGLNCDATDYNMILTIVLAAVVPFVIIIIIIIVVVIIYQKKKVSNRVISLQMEMTMENGINKIGSISAINSPKDKTISIIQL